jgi:hypothetical protein
MEEVVQVLHGLLSTTNFDRMSTLQKTAGSRKVNEPNPGANNKVKGSLYLRSTDLSREIQ